jgi:hypothetical protein
MVSRQRPGASGVHLEDVLECRLVQDGGDLALRLPEDPLHSASPAAAAGAYMVETAVELDRSLQRLE